MHIKIIKNFFVYLLLFPPLSLGIISCSFNNKSNPKLKETISPDFIQPIRAVAALGLGTIEIEGSDSLDNPNAVFQ